MNTHAYISIYPNDEERYDTDKRVKGKLYQKLGHSLNSKLGDDIIIIEYELVEKRRATRKEWKESIENSKKASLA